MSTTDPLGLIYTGRWDRRKKLPCNCHRLRAPDADRYSKPEWWPRLPAGKKWGEWCECMCEMHGKTREAAG